jgi:protein-arginine deiminase
VKSLVLAALCCGLLLPAAPAAATPAVARLHGDAIMLPNLDDDSRRCRVRDADLDAPGAEVDVRLAACNDAADEVVNGRRDALDLARLEVPRQPGLSQSATGRLTVDPPDKARVFVHSGGRWRTGDLTAADLRSGARIGVEARDVLRDPAAWDGTVTVTLTVTDRGGSWRTDHDLRVAPLLLQNDLQPATTVFAGRPGPGAGVPDGWTWPDPTWQPGEWASFASTLSATGADTRFVEGTAGWWQDVWWQDLFEPATASMPTGHGTQTMRVAIRSANIWDVPVPGGTVRTPRPAARLLFRDLRGPDVAVVQELVDDGRDGLTDLRNATGNIESLPPYRGYPQGRLVYGSSPTEALRPDPAFIRLFTAQGQQPPVVVDTSWLLVGHADETMHVVRANNALGWTLMVADPRLAVAELRSAQSSGAGGSRLFEGTSAKHKPSVDELLADGAFLAENEQAARHIDTQVTTMLGETGLRQQDLVRVPVLFHRPPEMPLFVALSPGIPNGLSVDARHFAAPDPHGPRVAGRDVFRAATERALRGSGVRVSWVEDLQWAHFGGGEVHCTTNAWRDTSRTRPWWR